MITSNMLILNIVNETKYKNLTYTDNDIVSFIGRNLSIIYEEYYYEIVTEELKSNEYNLIEIPKDLKKIQLILNKKECKKYIENKLKEITSLVENTKINPTYKNFALLRNKTDFEKGVDIFVVENNNTYEILNKLEFYSKYIDKNYIFELKKRILCIYD